MRVYAAPWSSTRRRERVTDPPWTEAPPAPDPESPPRQASRPSRSGWARPGERARRAGHALPALAQGVLPVHHHAPGRRAVVRPGEPVRLIPIPYYVGDAGAPRRLDVDRGGAIVGRPGRRPPPASAWSASHGSSAATALPARPILVDATDLVMPRGPTRCPSEADLVERALAVARIGHAKGRLTPPAAGVSEEESPAEAERRSASREATAARSSAAGAPPPADRARGPDRLRAGDCVLADIGCYLDGSRGEFARALAIDEPPASLVRAHAAPREALEGGGGGARPTGVPADPRRRGGRRPARGPRLSCGDASPTRSATGSAPPAVEGRRSRGARPTRWAPARCSTWSPASSMRQTESQCASTTYIVSPASAQTDPQKAAT